MLILVGIAVAYSLYGGLKAVALIDIIQVVLLVAGLGAPVESSTAHQFPRFVSNA